MKNLTKINVPKKYQSGIKSIEQTRQGYYVVRANSGYFFSERFQKSMVTCSSQKQVLEVIRTVELDLAEAQVLKDLGVELTPEVEAKLSEESTEAMPETFNSLNGVFQDMGKIFTETELNEYANNTYENEVESTPKLSLGDYNSCEITIVTTENTDCKEDLYEIKLKSGYKFKDGDHLIEYLETETEVLNLIENGIEKLNYKQSDNSFKAIVDIVGVRMVKESTTDYKTIGINLETITQPESVIKITKNYFEGLDREHFIVLCLDTKNNINNISTISIGSLNQAIVHPREVFKIAMLSNSANIICMHNHPSGNTSPSTADIKLTERLESAGQLLGINLLDHIIVGNNGNYTSLKESGYMN